MVTTSSPKWKRLEMYERALSFKRELKFDFIQWSHPDSVPKSDVNGYLFADAQGAIVGACSFCQRTSQSEKPYWGLEWIWITPKERKKAISRLYG